MEIASRILITAVLVSALLGALPDGAPGQTDIVTNIRAQIERNEELLVEAGDLVRATSSVKARAALDAARKLHQASKDALLRNDTALAGRTALRAREAILSAIATAKREAKLEDDCLNAIETASVRHERARALLDEQDVTDDQPAAKMVEESFHQLQRARNNMREHMFEVALHLAKASIELSNRAIKMLGRDGTTPEKILNEIARTDRILEQIETPGTGDLVRTLREARDLQDLARRNARDTKFRLALGQTKRARTLALRVLNESSQAGGNGRDTAEKAMNLTARLLEQAYEAAREHGVENAIGRLDDAAALQREATLHFQDGRYRGALRSTLTARDIVKETMRAIDIPFDADKVKGTLEQTNEILGKVREELAGKVDESAKALYERAASRQASAWAAYESGLPRKALAHTKIARNLAQKALRQLSDG